MSPRKRGVVFAEIQVWLILWVVLIALTQFFQSVTRWDLSPVSIGFSLVCICRLVWLVFEAAFSQES